MILNCISVLTVLYIVFYSMVTLSKGILKTMI